MISPDRNFSDAGGLRAPAPRDIPNTVRSIESQNWTLEFMNQYKIDFLIPWISFDTHLVHEEHANARSGRKEAQG